MSIKISANQSAVAHHIIDGPTVFPYAIDAHSAISRFPGEWSKEPWSRAQEAKARESAGQPMPEVTAEEQAEIDAHAQAVEEANERLKAFREKKAAEKAEADQIERDEALVKSPAPRPQPRINKPLTPAERRRKAAELTSEEQAEIEQREADERIVREKAEQDRWANATTGGAPITG